jgi:CheY-like chemotaxis protein
MMDRSGRRSAEQQNVLIVDGDGAGSRGHKKKLEALGYHVINAADGSAALTVARQTAPRVIFLGIDRFAIDRGSERTSFLQALRRDDSTRHIPVTMLPSDPERLERMGLSRIAREHW